jgi:hypothetical protein
MTRPPFEVADIVRTAGPQFRQRYWRSLTWPQIKVLNAIVRCALRLLVAIATDAITADINTSAFTRVETAIAQSARPMHERSGFAAVSKNCYRWSTFILSLAFPTCWCL